MSAPYSVDRRLGGVAEIDAPDRIDRSRPQGDALLAPPDRRCERPAYHFEYVANNAQWHDHLAVACAIAKRPRAYLTCRLHAPRPEREVF